MRSNLDLFLERLPRRSRSGADAAGEARTARRTRDSAERLLARVLDR